MSFTRSRGMTLRAAAIAVFTALPLISTNAMSAAPAHAAAVRVPVVIRHAADDGAAAEAAVTRLGGVVQQRLTALDSLTARMPAAELRHLASAAGILAVTPDRSVRLAADQWTASKDANSLYNITKQTGAQRVWDKRDDKGRTITGKGVGVALIDSGVAPVKGLADAGKVINGPDLSFESQADNLRYLDTYGHGTHLAGIIAGRDPEVKNGSENDPRYFTGVAPDAHLISLKVAVANGAVDVSQVIAAIDWVVSHRNDPQLNIKVLNLSFGTDSPQDPVLDPLSYAVEAAWKKGIVVVVSVGNDGERSNRVSMPAANPYVIAVGAADPMNNDDRADDTVPAFSARGTDNARHPDLVAAGKSVASLRDPNSYIDTRYPGGLISGEPDKRFFRGTGTSQAAAVVSGAAALLLQQRPTLTPDQVKRMLTSTADDMPKADKVGRGAGQLDIKKAIAARTPTYTQTFAAATGLGSLDQSRGSARVSDATTGVELRGEVDIMGHAWDPSAWAAQCAAGTTWNGGTWNGTAWTGTGWTGTGGSWSGRTWSGTTWSGTTWSGTTWSGTTWSGTTWSGTTWSGTTWSGTTWSGTIWGP